MSYKSFSKQQDTLSKKDEKVTAGEPAGKESEQQPEVLGPPVKPSEDEPTTAALVRDS